MTNATRFRWQGLALGTGLAVLLCGCRSLRPAPEPAVETAVPAEALAAYARGLREDFSGAPDRAILHYLEAADWDPSRSPPYVRALAAHATARRRGIETDLAGALEDLALRHPGESEPLRWIARLHASEDRIDEAILAYERGLRRNPSEERLHAERLPQLLRAERFSDLPGAFREALRRRADPTLLAVPAGQWLQRTDAKEGPGMRRDALRALDQIQARAEGQADVLMLLGQVYRNSGEEARARAAFEQAQQAAPDLPDVYLQQALLHLAQDDFAAARAALSSGIEKVEQPLDLLRLLTEAATQHALRLAEEDADGEAGAAREQAIGAVRRLIDSLPGEDRLRLRLGDLLILSGRTGEAVHELGRILRPDAQLQQEMVRRFLAAGAQEEAVALLQVLTAERPGEETLHLLLAELLLQAGRYTEAMEGMDALRKATGEPASPAHRLYRALTLQYAGQTDEAARLMAVDVAGDPVLMEPFVMIAARLDAETGDREASRATLEALAAKLPDQAGVQLFHGLYEHIAGEHERATDLFGAVHRAAKTRIPARELLTAQFHFMYGAASERTGLYEQAMEQLTEAIRLEPDHADALNYLAYMWAERSMELERALEYVTRALERDPGNAAYIDTLGWIYYRQGRYEEAKVELKRALEGMPDDPTILDHVGDVLHELGRSGEAVGYWKRAMENDPENPEEIREKLREQGVEVEPATERRGSEPFEHAVDAGGEPPDIARQV